MKKMMILLCCFSFFSFSSSRRNVTITPNLELGGNLSKLVNGTTAGAANIGVSLDFKTNMNNLETKNVIEIGAGLRQDVQVTNKTRIYGSTMLYFLGEFQHKFKPNLGAYGVFRIGPGVSYGTPGWKNENDDNGPASKVVLAGLGDLEGGVEYKNIRAGLVVGGFIPLHFGNLTSTSAQFKIGIKLGYDINTLRF